ncbi:MULTISPECIES: 5'-nucleotidase C-terminal domain-containing protein [unclassified Prevotella]|uniref:5'-nucleotidase C-terminal domain-containing protein n=1 Tax=unclassified Prevotella TaxID=2638335 RepID=UPI000513DC45|nr:MULTISPECIES: 5'-nucleotidase [unclassified Prevotella]KGI60315.1 5'-nucleotidase [Prevotella sp. S7 MS 2]
MKHKYTGLGVALVGMMMVSCHSHYQLTGIQRTRIIIDKRYDQPQDAEAAAFLKPYKQQIDSIMKPVVGTLAKPMFARRPESTLSNLLADIMVWGGKDFNEHPVMGLYNMGGIRAGLSKGNITVGDVVRIAPFENKICFITLSGEALMELFSNIASVGGEGVSKGVTMQIKDRKLVSVTLNGQPIDPNKQYRIATIDYLAQGNDHMTALKRGTDLLSPQSKENDTRFIIMNYFKEMQAEGKVVDSNVEGRIVVLK